MVETVALDGVPAALILRSGYQADGVQFLTEDEGLLQLGYMNHPAGHRIAPHVHTTFTRVTEGTQEVLFIKSGRIRVDFYTDDGDFRESRELETGDLILFLGQGHGFEMLEPTVMIEVKNGPYAGDRDKTRFTPGMETG